MLHVVLIDDDVDLVTSNRMALESKGHKVSTAHSGQEGYTLLSTIKPDVIVLDCMMENFTAGFELANDIALLHPQIPMIMLTSVHDHMNEGWQFGNKDKKWLPIHKFLEKPVPPMDLVLEVEKISQR